jgi:hypothetical protein
MDNINKRPTIALVFIANIILAVLVFLLIKNNEDKKRLSKEPDLIPLPALKDPVLGTELILTEVSEQSAASNPAPLSAPAPKPDPKPAPKPAPKPTTKTKTS